MDQRKCIERLEAQIGLNQSHIYFTSKSQYHQKAYGQLSTTIFDQSILNSRPKPRPIQYTVHSNCSAKTATTSRAPRESQKGLSGDIGGITQSELHYRKEMVEGLEAHLEVSFLYKVSKAAANHVRRREGLPFVEESKSMSQESK
jgi:hypothetical protein